MSEITRSQTPRRLSFGRQALIAFLVICVTGAFGLPDNQSKIQIASNKQSNHSVKEGVNYSPIDNLLNDPNCSVGEFMLLDPDVLDIPRGVSHFSLEDKDISHLWNLPEGSVVLTIYGANTAQNVSKFVVGQAFEIEFKFEGTVPLVLRPSHSYRVEAGSSDGFFNFDTPYELESSLAPGLITYEIDGTYVIENTTTSDIDNEENFTWTSLEPADNILFFTLEDDLNNGIWLEVAPILCETDTDGDGVPDSVDIDDDGDGILDSEEDPNLDGDDDPTTDPQDSDDDGNPDHLDIDSDNDGIPDNVEGQPTDGYIPPSGEDTDEDGLDDAYEPDGIDPQDTDGDMTPDYLDQDSDNDTVPDNNEGNDFNFDGIPDQTFTGEDTDGDGLDDGYEGSDVNDGPDPNDEIEDPANDLPNTDGEGDVNYRDIDDDNDGIPTEEEDANEDGDPTNDDTDDDGTPDYLDPDQPDDMDFDGDGVPDSVDIDDDGDGILDSEEDPNLDGDDDPTTDPQDSDGDGNPDHLDIDADNDGIPDNVEGQPTDGYIPPSGMDEDQDGLDDAYEPDGIDPQDTDGDTTPDYLDQDSDNDLVPDNNEGNDFNFDGIPDQDFTGVDSDGDGLDDGYEGNDINDGPDPNDEIEDPLLDLPDTDGTEDVNYRDFDDDGDGIDTPDEDADMDGDPTNDDTDDDGTPDYLDPVDDTATVSEVIVNQLVSPNGDGRNDFLFIQGVELTRNSNMQIFNRWGISIYQGENYDNINNVFDGRSKGRSTISTSDYLPAGIYYYIFEYERDNQKITDQGFLYLGK